MGDVNLRRVELRPTWTRVATESSARTRFVLDADADGGRARVFSRHALDGATPDDEECTDVTLPPGTVVYMKARARGVSLVAGTRAHTRAPSTIVYVRHCAFDAAGGSHATIVILRDYAPARTLSCYSYALPRACTATVHYGARVSARLVQNELDAYASGSVQPDPEPFEGAPVLPQDVCQAVAWVDAELRRRSG